LDAAVRQPNIFREPGVAVCQCRRVRVAIGACRLKSIAAERLRRGVVAVDQRGVRETGLNARRLALTSRRACAAIGQPVELYGFLSGRRGHRGVGTRRSTAIICDARACEDNAQATIRLRN